MTTVSTSAFYDRSNTDMAGLRARANALQTSIGSGQRLGTSSDDPVAAARVRTLTRLDSFAEVDNTAAGRASADLMLTDHTLSQFSGSVIRVKELAIQAANGILTAAQRAGIATELEQIGSELGRLANSTIRPDMRCSAAMRSARPIPSMPAATRSMPGPPVPAICRWVMASR